MTSNDREVLTVSEFQSGIDGLKVYVDGRLLEQERRLDARLDELKAEIQVLDRKIELNMTKIDMLQHYQTLGFTVIAIVVAFSAFMLTLAPTLLEVFKDKRKAKRDEEMREIVQEEISRAMSARG